MRRAVGLWATFMFLSSCGGDTTGPLAPFDPEISNATDSFQLQATDVTDVSATLEYEWQNTGTLANVDHSTTTISGTARLVVRAANGTEVYDELLVPSLSESTGTGGSGSWRIRLVLSGYSGTLNFRLQKP